MERVGCVAGRLPPHGPEPRDRTLDRLRAPAVRRAGTARAGDAAAVDLAAGMRAEPVAARFRAPRGRGPARRRDPARRARRISRRGAALVARGAREGLGDRPRHHGARRRPGHRRRHPDRQRGDRDARRRRGRVPRLRAEPRVRLRHPRGERCTLGLRLRDERGRRRWHRVARVPDGRRRLAVRRGRRRADGPANGARVRVGAGPGHVRADVGPRVRGRHRSCRHRGPGPSGRGPGVPRRRDRPRVRAGGRGAVRHPSAVHLRHQHRGRRRQLDPRLPDHRRRRIPIRLRRPDWDRAREHRGLGLGHRP